MYRFAGGILPPDISTDQFRAGIRLPSICSPATTVGCGFGGEDSPAEFVIRLYMSPEAPPGPHIFGFTLPDGRSAETRFMAVGSAAPPVAGSPTPSPSATPGPVAQTYTVRGRVTDAATGAPVGSVNVDTWAFDASGDRRGVAQPPRAQTGVDGTYMVAVPKDPAVSYYWVEFAAPEGSRYVRQFWKGIWTWDVQPTRLTLTGDRVDIDAALAVGFYISGSVTSQASGSPVEGILVQPTFRGRVARRDDMPTDPQGVTTLSVPAATLWGGVAITDAAGNYRFSFPVPEGRYLIQFNSSRQKGHGSQWWRGATSSAEATEVVVRGADVGGINAALVPNP